MLTIVLWPVRALLNKILGKPIPADEAFPDPQ